MSCTCADGALTVSHLQAEVNQGLQQGLEVLRQQRALAEALAQGRGEEVQGLKLQVQDLTGRLTEAEERVQQGELIRRKLHNTILVSIHGMPANFAMAKLTTVIGL